MGDDRRALAADGHLPAARRGRTLGSAARDREAALGDLLGRRRAEVLAALATPRSTLDVAQHLQASAAGVSAHLKALREAGLVTGRREGRQVLYARTPLGDALLRPVPAPRPADRG